MTNDTNQSEERPELRERGALLRAAADGELTAAERARLDAMLCACPEDECCVAFEGELRRCCGRAMTTSCCPESLCERVQTIAGDARAASEHSIDRIERHAIETRKQSFWSSRGGQRMALAAAAAVLLVLGVVLVMQSVQLTGPGAPGTGRLVSTDFQEQIGGFLASEHSRCFEAEVAAQKFTMVDAAAAHEKLDRLMEAHVELPALAHEMAGVVFRDAGPCHVPGADGRSCHVRFTLPATGHDEPVTVSIFVAPVIEGMELDEGVTYTLGAESCGEGGASVRVWQSGELVYYLVADAGTGGCLRALAAMGLPEPTHRI